MFPSHQNYNTGGRKSQSERIKVRLSSDLMPAVIFVIFLFREHIIHDSDCEQIKFREGQSLLLAFSPLIQIATLILVSTLILPDS